MVLDRFFGTSEAESDESDPTLDEIAGKGPEGAEPPMSLTGEPYQITEAEHVWVGGKRVRTETADQGPVAGPYVREMLESGIHEPQKSLWIGYDDGAQTGFREAPIRFESLFRHLWISGTTGAGKTTVLQNKAVQHAYAGHGFCNIDPKASGDTLELLQQLPPDRLDDIIFFEPGAPRWDRTIGINMLDMPETDSDEELEREIESRLENLIAIFDNDEYWGVNMEAITESMGRAMLRANAEATDPSEKYSIIDMYFILLNAERRQAFAEAVDDPYLEEFLAEIGKMDDETIRPLTKRIKRWVENAVIRKIIARRASTVDWDEILSNDRILLIRISVDNEDIHQMVTLTVLRNLWSAKKRQDRAPNRASTPYFVQIDEFEKVANDNLDIEGMLARARSMNLSVTLGTQYPGQIEAEHPDTKRAMENNCNTLLAMRTPGETDSKLLMQRFQGYSGEDLQSTNLYQAWTKIPLSGGRESEPVKITTFPPYPPLRDEAAVTAVIQRSLETYGAPPLTDGEIQRELKYGEFNEAVQPAASAARAGAGAIDGPDEGGEAADDRSFTPSQRATVLESIFAARVQADVQRGTFEPGRWVPLAEAKRELRRREDNAVGLGTSLSELAQAYEVISDDYARTAQRSGTPHARLTEEGRALLFQQDTGASSSGGSMEHRLVLRTAYTVFTTLGYNVSLPTQGGEERCDGVAESPLNPASKQTMPAIRAAREELEREYPAVWALSEGRDVSIEAETSTQTYPHQTFRNLRKAIEQHNLCVYVTKDGERDKGEFAYWARRIAKVHFRADSDNDLHFGELTFTERETADGRELLYSAGEPYAVTVDGEEQKAVRPTPEYADGDVPRDAASTKWYRDVDTGAYVMCYAVNRAIQAECARFPDAEAVASAGAAHVPAYYEYDYTDDEYVVYTSEGEKQHYGTESQFDQHWETFTGPFIPEVEFPREPTEADFKILIIPDADSERTQPHLYHHGETTPLFDELGISADSFTFSGDDSAVDREAAPDPVSESSAAADDSKPILAYPIMIAAERAFRLAEYDPHSPVANIGTHQAADAVTGPSVTDSAASGADGISDEDDEDDLDAYVRRFL